MTFVLPGSAYGSVTLSSGPAGAAGAAFTLPMIATMFVKSYPAGWKYSVVVRT